MNASTSLLRRGSTLRDGLAPLRDGLAPLPRRLAAAEKQDKENGMEDLSRGACVRVGMHALMAVLFPGLAAAAAPRGLLCRRSIVAPPVASWAPSRTRATPRAQPNNATQRRWCDGWATDSA